MPTNLRDAFTTAGVGWRNTITNEAPFLRIDQVWVNDFLDSVQVFAAVASDTDYRLVLADLLLKSKSEPGAK